MITSHAGQEVREEEEGGEPPPHPALFPRPGASATASQPVYPQSAPGDPFAILDPKEGWGTGMGTGMGGRGAGVQPPRPAGPPSEMRCQPLHKHKRPLLRAPGFAVVLCCLRPDPAPSPRATPPGLVTPALRSICIPPNPNPNPNPPHSPSCFEAWAGGAVRTRAPGPRSHDCLAFSPVAGRL